MDMLSLHLCPSFEKVTKRQNSAYIEKNNSNHNNYADAYSNDKHHNLQLSAAPYKNCFLKCSKKKQINDKNNHTIMNPYKFDRS